MSLETHEVMNDLLLGLGQNLFKGFQKSKQASTYDFVKGLTITKGVSTNQKDINRKHKRKNITAMEKCPCLYFQRTSTRCRCLFSALYGRMNVSGYLEGIVFCPPFRKRIIYIEKHKSHTFVNCIQNGFYTFQVW